MRKFGFAAALMLAGITVAEAQPISATTYTYYTISGDSAVELYQSMIRRGPHVNGAKAYASTGFSTLPPSGKLVQGKSCRIVGFRQSLKFVIRLPKFNSAAGLAADTRSRWNAFSSFVRKHEETHRAIWTNCAQGLESKVSAIRAPDCKSAETRALRLWADMRQSCQRRHDAFDAAEQKRLVRHPFVQLALAGAGQSSRGAVIRKSKKKRRA